jgi:hypothetical protein
MRTLQCPRCQLRFRTRSEAFAHLRQDHRRPTGTELAARLHGAARRGSPQAKASR